MIHSVIFSGNIYYIKGYNIIFGGTGVDYSIKLPEYADSCDLDYSIYEPCDTSYGFISRGCIRNCPFCVVPKKEGKLHQVSTIDKIIKHKKVKFLDNNFLALPNHKELLREIINKNIKCRFDQGLDIRLIDKENSILLHKLNYLRDYIFAFDDYSYINIIKSKLKLLEWRKDYQFKFFVYTSPEMSIDNIVKRIEYLKSIKQLPYIMRHISCWSPDYHIIFGKNNTGDTGFYTDIATYCNQPGIFKKMSFSEFLEKRHTDNNRIKKSRDLYYNNL